VKGFGFTFENGGIRTWYVGEDGVKRYMDDTPVAPVEPDPEPAE